MPNEVCVLFSRHCFNLTVTIIYGFIIIMHHYIYSLLRYMDFFVVWRHSIGNLHDQLQFPPKSHHLNSASFNPYPTAFPYGNGMVLHFYQQQESSTTKTVHKVINKGLKTYVLSLHTGENFH